MFVRGYQMSDCKEITELFYNCLLYTSVITMEDGILSGGFGEKIASFYGSSDMKVKNYGLDKKFYDRYDPNELLKEVGMTPVQIIADICNQIK